MLATPPPLHPARAVDAVVAFYGLPDDRFTGGAARLWDAARVRVPCQLHFPSAAPGLEGFDDVAEARALLPALAPGSELHEYRFAEGANGHGFLNGATWWEEWKAAATPPRPPYSEEQARLAIDRAERFFAGVFAAHL